LLEHDSAGGSFIRVKSRIITIRLISFKDFNELPVLPSRERVPL
jgi:hypothetical protein